MSLQYNGAKTIPCANSDTHKRSEKTLHRSSLDSSNSKKEVFRGFTKTPLVSVERMDIDKWLKPYKSSGNSITTNALEKPNLESFYQKCSVNIINVDLIKLRERVKEDPNDPYFNMVSVKCQICNKEYPNAKKLQNHKDNKHIIFKPKTHKRVSFSDTVIVHEVREYHKCRKCTKIFEEYKSLKFHMKTKHKKRKCYVCDYCKKKFVDRTIFKVHIKLHCDVCSQLFSSKSKYLEHRRSVCRTLKLHKCKTCNTAFFKFIDLKDHCYEHIHNCFVCDVCKDQFQTKCVIAHHIKYLHSEKRPTALYVMHNFGIERLYSCNFCEESSVDKEVIEKHVEVLPDLTNRVMTGYKDYYFCDQCLHKFDTEQELLQHKWSHFLKTTDNFEKRPSLLKGKILKTKYKINEIPEYFKPVVLLEKIKVNDKVPNEEIPFVNVECFDIFHGSVTKPVQKSRKTLLSKHQCELCNKYLSSGYCLARHRITVHGDYDTFQCKVCEETFAWASLLNTHKCIRVHRSEMPFDDARPEIFFDNNGLLLDDLNITDNEDYMNSVDFEIPAPIVELTEYDECFNFDNRNNLLGNNSKEQSSGNYKIVMQEVPIEF